MLGTLTKNGILKMGECCGMQISQQFFFIPRVENFGEVVQQLWK